MHNYTIIIFLPVTDWLSKITTEFLILGWKISPCAEDNKLIHPGTLSGSISFSAEIDQSKFNTTQKVRDFLLSFLSQNEISFFGIVVHKKSAISWAPSATKLKIEPKSVYRG